MTGAGAGGTTSNRESTRVLGGRLSQEAHVSEQQYIEDEVQELVVSEESSSYSNAYANFTAHAARLSNVLQGRPHLVKKYSGLMAQLYAAAVKDITECDVAPRHSSGSDGTISLCPETSKLRKKPKRLGSY
jgi:hypothetical protein